MRASELWPAETKFVEIDAQANLFGERLLKAGFDGYLGVVRSLADRKRLASHNGRLAARIAVSQDRRVVRNNNADVLVLHGAAGIGAIRFRNLRHASYVAFPCRIGLGEVVGYLACLFHALLRRLDAPRFVSIDANKPNARLWCFECGGGSFHNPPGTTFPTNWASRVSCAT
jgi:hypothetical protein